MSKSFNQNLPADLAGLLADARIMIPGESDVLEMVAEWTLARSETPSASGGGNGDLAADLRGWASAASSTTPAAV